TEVMASKGMLVAAAAGMLVLSGCAGSVPHTLTPTAPIFVPTPMRPVISCYSPAVVQSGPEDAEYILLYPNAEQVEARNSERHGEDNVDCFVSFAAHAAPREV